MSISFFVDPPTHLDPTVTSEYIYVAPNTCGFSDFDELIDLSSKSINSPFRCSWRSLCAYPTLPIDMWCGRSPVLSLVTCGCRMVAVNVTPGLAYGTAPRRG